MSLLPFGSAPTRGTSTPTANKFAKWDANANMSANSFIAGYASTATAAGTTTLTVSSAEQQYFTGTTTQTCKLPVTSTLHTGMQYQITNLSTGIVTVESSGGNTLQAMAPNTLLIATVIGSGHTDTTDWSWTYQSLTQSAGSLAYSQAYTNPTASWTTTSLSYADPTVSGTPSITVRQSSGLTLTQAGSNYPGITFTPSSSGAVYYISVSVSTAGNNAASINDLQLYDGTSVIAQSPSAQLSGTANRAMAITFGGVYVPGTTSPVTVRLQMAVNVGTGMIGQQNIENPIEWTVQQIAAPVVSTVSPTSQYAQAYTTQSVSWSTTSLSFVDPTNNGTSALVVIYSSSLSLTIGGSTNAGITFTPASASAVYMITANSDLGASASEWVEAQLTDGTTILDQTASFSSATTDGVPCTLSSIYAPGTASSVTVKIQIRTSGGTALLGESNTTTQALNWTIFRIA